MFSVVVVELPELNCKHDEETTLTECEEFALSKPNRAGQLDWLEERDRR
jgi:hypothetical protein